MINFNCYLKLLGMLFSVSKYSYSTAYYAAAKTTAGVILITLAEGEFTFLPVIVVEY